MFVSESGPLRMAAAKGLKDRRVKATRRAAKGP